ncbi:hypothetical protein AB0L75_03410 [Streptomyces sp. NPDC052101]|uniref:hypothetical protein n=1 Tax=Streptomyces sp. NPDC052101 TaxID=3155763 RepID=UPI00341B989F
MAASFRLPESRPAGPGEHKEQHEETEHEEEGPGVRNIHGYPRTPGCLPAPGEFRTEQVAP